MACLTQRAASNSAEHTEMDLKWNTSRVSHPDSAADQVTDLSWRGNLNPSPLIKDDGELLVDEYLSPRKLKILTGVNDLQQVNSLKVRVDTRENSLGNFGAYLPNLRELQLNNSLLMSVRDLGTTLSHLYILWMAHCELTDLDGISSCSSLRELYIAYNNISDLSQLPWLDHLEVLDLEGNNIEDINQMQYLGLCCKLSRLTVEGNPICLKPNAESAQEPDYNYRAEVKKLIPHLEYLDEIPASQTALLPPNRMHEDWLIIKESIKEGGLAGDISWLAPGVQQQSPYWQCTVMVWFEALNDCAYSSKISVLDPCLSPASRPGTVQSSAHAGRSSSACLLHGGCPLPDPTVSDELFTEDDSSDLIHGLSQVMCGSHTEALCARRQKLGLALFCSTKAPQDAIDLEEDRASCPKHHLMPSKIHNLEAELERAPEVIKIISVIFQPPAVSPLKLRGLRTEKLYSSEGGGSLHQEDVLSELSAKREQQKRCLHRGQQEKVTQALRITLSDEEEGEDFSLTDSYEGETSDKDLIERISLDSPCHSCLSQSSSGSSQDQEGAVFSNPNHCLIPSPPKTPSPASVTGVAARSWKKRNHRIRCLKTPSQEDRQWVQQCQPRAHQENSAQPQGTKFALLSQHSMLAASGSPGQHQPAGSTGQQRPTSIPTAAGSTSIRPIVDESLPGEINHHQPAVCSSTKAPQRSGLMNTAWPLTARAMLQPLPHRPTSSTSQKRSPQS
ncbi:LOW QUALITY PROTEIN: leucine-rich repeat-containing protein 56 [Neopsephotus bourkii]|uniref:LOW QUALITY PROTEIN: leucine-rich repeat-containing protein 56 n=1 Tax=Neopsephotus bourkii TaxID=309878 RepID=UPI002AA589D0|nr:LOW QUALITY PROTEIN: leucine-rich repeat-containing protein 56 [Neopsephotus bourkii]